MEEQFFDILDRLKLGRPFRSLLDRIESMHFHAIQQGGNPNTIVISPSIYKTFSAQMMPNARYTPSNYNTVSPTIMKVNTSKGELTIKVDINEKSIRLV